MEKTTEEQGDQEIAGKKPGSHRIGSIPSHYEHGSAHPWLTFIFLGMNTGVFLLETLIGVRQHSYATLWDWIWISPDVHAPLLRTMGALGPGNMVWIQPWRFLTSFFLHAGFLHYALNMWGLVACRQTERTYGQAGYLLIYLCGGLASGLGAMMTFLFFPTFPYNVGASGALYALVTATVLARGVKQHRSWRTWLAVGGFGVVFMSMGNLFAHLSGAVMGGSLDGACCGAHLAEERKGWRVMSNKHSAGKKISVRGRCFAYLCLDCQDTVRVSRFFQTEMIGKAHATQEHAYCYRCYRGLDGSEENFRAYHVGPTADGQLLPSAFSLLEVGLACEALTKPPTVARVYRQLLEDGMIWTSETIQAALHAMFPDAIAPVFLEEHRQCARDADPSRPKTTENHASTGPLV
ncbi:hypothetical protein KSF_106710 [Reticulibacter mediterranei]|uniref:Peptidase S54 rhomboid domain-containing protein n=1 Tax=Reticulibacter mediterranei TaxID=2778369 RepID=A0A8J3IU36_9CHLR|nr:rhomboid family intramembrane serine protease [Reticulibacter mediterranei]GHP00624.1 hypothetical protein KSF_106710 [Reticulibacter mediterranei]